MKLFHLTPLLLLLLLLLCIKPFSSTAIESSAKDAGERRRGTSLQKRESVRRAEPFLFPGEKKRPVRSIPQEPPKRVHFADEIDGGKLATFKKPHQEKKEKANKGDPIVDQPILDTVKKTHLSTTAIPQDELEELLAAHSIDDTKLRQKYSLEIREKESDDDTYCEVGPPSGESEYPISFFMNREEQAIRTRDVSCTSSSRIVKHFDHTTGLSDCSLDDRKVQGRLPIPPKWTMRGALMKGKDDNVFHSNLDTGIIKVFKDPLINMKDINKYHKCTLTADALSGKIVDLEEVKAHNSYYALAKALCHLYDEAAKTGKISDASSVDTLDNTPTENNCFITATPPKESKVFREKGKALRSSNTQQKRHSSISKNTTGSDVELQRMARLDGTTTMTPDMPIERAQDDQETNIKEDDAISSPTLCNWNLMLATYDLNKQSIFKGFPKPLVLTAKEMDDRIGELAEMFKTVDDNIDGSTASDLEDKSPSLLSLDIFNASIGNTKVNLSYFKPDNHPNGIAPLGERRSERYVNLALFLMDERDRNKEHDKFLRNPLQNAMKQSGRKWAGKGIVEVMKRLKPTLEGWGLMEDYVSFGSINNDIIIALKRNRKVKACEGVILGNVNVNPYLHLLIDRATLGEWPLFYSTADYLAFADRRKDSELMAYDEVKDVIEWSGRIKFSTGKQRNLHTIDQVLAVMFTTPPPPTPKKKKKSWKNSVALRWVEAMRRSRRQQFYDFNRDTE